MRKLRSSRGVPAGKVTRGLVSWLQPRRSHRAPVERSQKATGLPWLRRIHSSRYRENLIGHQITSGPRRATLSSDTLLRFTMATNGKHRCTATNVWPLAPLKFGLPVKLSKNWPYSSAGRDSKAVPTRRYYRDYYCPRSDWLITRTRKSRQCRVPSLVVLAGLVARARGQMETQREQRCRGTEDRLAVFKLISRGCVQIFHPRRRHFCNWHRRDGTA